MAEPGMMDMLKQARGLQKKMGKIQKKVEKRDVQAEAGGGMVQVVCSGKLRVKRILIDQEVLGDADKRVVQDLVLAGVNAALEKAQDMVNREMGKVAAEMGLPGGDVPEDDGGAPEESSGGGGLLNRWRNR